jgi:cysteine synthase A
MNKIYDSVEQLIGSTPIVRLNNLKEKLGLKANLLAKVECFNPAGSVKDRVALNMINEAEKSGALKQGGTVIEPTSGNTGIGICAIAAARGYKAIIVMPDTMSKERMQLISAYGAKLVLTDGSLGMAGAIKKAEEIKAETNNSIIAGQFVNPANWQAHFKTTGPEIYDATKGNIDFFVAGVGTGGTVTGVGKYLKSKNDSIKIVGVEPNDSPVLSGGKAGPHKLQGIGAGFIPEVLDKDILDEVMTVSAEDAFETGRILCQSEGLLCGISSGAALYAAITLAKKEENKDKNIVVLLPDTGERYLTTEMFQ